MTMIDVQQLDYITRQVYLATGTLIDEKQLQAIKACGIPPCSIVAAIIGRGNDNVAWNMGSFRHRQDNSPEGIHAVT
jgi:hypothetical protein